MFLRLVSDHGSNSFIDLRKKQVTMLITSSVQSYENAVDCCSPGFYLQVKKKSKTFVEMMAENLRKIVMFHNALLSLC